MGRGESDPSRYAYVTSLTDGRRALNVYLGSVKRAFMITAWSRGIQALSGSTPDLREVARVAAAWRHGIPLSEIRSRSLFPKVGSLAEAQELGGAAAAVALRWREMREQAAGSPRFEPFGKLVETASAYSRPELRVLFPFTSHSVLHLSQCTGFPFSWTVPFVDYLEHGRYLVRGPRWRDVIGEADTADQAVSLVVTNLPEGCGPAVAGTANELRASRRV